MLRRLRFLILYFIVWVIFFELCRIFFILYEWQYTSLTPRKDLILSLWYGLKMDMSMSAYISIPVGIFLLLSVYIYFFRRRLIYAIYTGIILFILIVIVMVDVEIYRAWGHRADATPLNYISNPAEMRASIAHLPVVWIVLALIIFFILIFWLWRKWIITQVDRNTSTTFRGLQIFLLLVFTVLLIIPMRGGLQLSPLNHSSVFFSNNQFANNAALNAPWNFFHSLTHRNEFLKNPYETDEQRAETLVASLFQHTGSFEQVIDSTRKRPNILFILWESFTEKALHINFDGVPVAPYFEQLKKEGIYFSNCYASGDRTNKGISAVLSGYPALPKNSIINYPQKLPKLDGLGKTLAKEGYSNWFYYGGEPEFANMKGYILDQQFTRLISKDDFAKKDQNSKWGAHDDVVMKKILMDMKGMQQPFFTTFLTLTSHEPFETPVPTVFHGKTFSNRLMNTIHYTDSCLFQLIGELKKEPWWNNTLVVIVADHGHYEPSTGERADDYRVPLLWLGGALSKKDTIITGTVNQLDIPRTLLNQMGLDASPYPFSRDLFGIGRNNWAFFTYNDGIGLITDSSRMIYDNAGQRVVYEQGKVGRDQQELAKALMWRVYDDFLKR